MHPFGWKCVLFLCAIVSSGGALGAPALAAELAPELHVRDGLPNVAAKLQAGEEVRVAFLGGSITAAEGWRVFVLEHLRRAYPKSKFTEIFAAVSGTGSNYGAPRLQRDVLRHRPDLLFVEFAVNDGSGSPRVEAQIEGIVRQTRAVLPRTDVCLVYTVSSGGLKDLQSAGLQSTARSMENVATHYGVPSFNFGIAVAQRVQAGTLVMSAPASVAADAQGNDPQGRLIFTRDNTHPTDAGHHLYNDRLVGALPAMLQAGSAGARALPEPRRADHWQRARLLTVAETHHDGQWLELPPFAPQATAQKGEGLVPPLRVAFEPGATVEFRFKGTQVGLIGLKGPDNGEFRMTVDDLPPETGTLFDSFSTPGRYYLKPWYFSKTLPDTEHRVRLELLPTKIDKAAIMKKAGTPITDPKPYAAHGLYLGGFLLVGEPVGTKPPAAERKTPASALDLPVAPTPPPGYQLGWADEFDGNALNPEQWIYRTGERYWSTQLPDNVAVHDGYLWLAGKKEKSGKSDYTAGGVISKRVFRYGYYEARFKVPPKAGWHTSFWMMHHAAANATARPGSRQEIDVCENDSVTPKLYGANLHEWAPQHFGRGHRNVRTPDLAADFHVWGCEFTPEKVTYYFDGRIVLVNDATTIPDHGEMSLWLTTIASPLGNTRAVDDTALPAYAVFDYVRFYAKP